MVAQLACPFLPVRIGTSPQCTSPHFNHFICIFIFFIILNVSKSSFFITDLMDWLLGFIFLIGIKRCVQKLVSSISVDSGHLLTRVVFQERSLYSTGATAEGLVCSTHAHRRSY